MLQSMKKAYYMSGVAVTMGLMGFAPEAMAQTAIQGTTGPVTGQGNNFGTIGRNITQSIADLPGLLTALSYLMGLLLGVLGVMKIKDHVENPSNTPMKEGAIRLAAGGALFALPIIFEAMQNTVGAGDDVAPETLNAVSFGVN